MDTYTPNQAAADIKEIRAKLLALPDSWWSRRVQQNLGDCLTLIEVEGQEDEH